MKKLNITKEHFNKSRYFQRKYGKLEYVSESGRLFKTNKGKVLKFRESKKMNESNEEQDIKEVIDNLGDIISDLDGVICYLLYYVNRKDLAKKIDPIRDELYKIYCEI